MCELIAFPSKYALTLFMYLLCRVRPQSAAEKIDMCRICTTVMDDSPQIVLGKDKAFTYDYVFDTTSHQEEIFTNIARELIDGYAYYIFYETEHLYLRLLLRMALLTDYHSNYRMTYIYILLIRRMHL